MSQSILSRSQRRKTERLLLEIWSRRDVPAMPLEQFRELPDVALIFVHRFWTHKDRHWAETDAALAKQPDFTDPPPFGWAAFDKAGLNPPPPPTPKELNPLPGSVSTATGQRKAPGGTLTPRQACKING